MQPPDAGAIEETLPGETGMAPLRAAMAVGATAVEKRSVRVQIRFIGVPFPSRESPAGEVWVGELAGGYQGGRAACGVRRSGSWPVACGVRESGLWLETCGVRRGERFSAAG